MPFSLACVSSDRVFELQSFPLQSDEDFAQLQVLALTRGPSSSRVGLTPSVVQGQQVNRTKFALDLFYPCREFCLIV